MCLCNRRVSAGVDNGGINRVICFSVRHNGVRMRTFHNENPSSTIICAFTSSAMLVQADVNPDVYKNSLNLY